MKEFSELQHDVWDLRWAREPEYTKIQRKVLLTIGRMEAEIKEQKLKIKELEDQIQEIYKQDALDGRW